jgi:hypothetical protein
MGPLKKLWDFLLELGRKTVDVLKLSKGYDGALMNIVF